MYSPSFSSIKRAAKFYWAEKGLIPDFLHTMSDEELDRLSDSYMNRLWGNNEAHIHFEGFDEAWIDFTKQEQTKDNYQ